MGLENVLCKALYSEKKGVWNAPKRCEIHSKPQPLLQKTCIFHTSKTLAVYAVVCLRTHAFGPCTWAEGYFGPLFPKIGFCSFKKLYFPF